VRLLFVADRLSTRGGADQHMLQMIASAAGGGAKATVAAGRLESGLDLPAGIDVVRIRELAAAVASDSGLDALSRLVAGADVVHLQNVMNPDAVRRSVARGRTLATIQDHRTTCPGPGRTLPDGTPCTQRMDTRTCADCLPDAAYRQRMLELTVARHAALEGARLIVLSNWMADELGRSGRSAVVLPPWVEAGPERATPGESVLLAGRLVRHKAPETAVAAWRRAGCGLPLRVAGSGPLQLEGDGIEFLGWLERDALAAEMRGARLLLFPARWQEPFGLVGVEALAQGTPVVVSDVGGTRDWSTRGSIRVSAGDVGEMALAIRELAEDPDRALDLGREGRRHVADRFSREALEPRLWGLWERAACGDV
jgi:glycosyltransferase involved in cell wall biosynthesis